MMKINLTLYKFLEIEYRCYWRDKNSIVYLRYINIITNIAECNCQRLEW